MPAVAAVNPSVLYVENNRFDRRGAGVDAKPISFFRDNVYRS
jgi:hypothetical protein